MQRDTNIWRLAATLPDALIEKVAVHSRAPQTSVVRAVAELLADTYRLGLKAQNFHWNVTGPQFQQLHKLFGDQYDELSDATDEIAEHLRALGSRAPASFAEFETLSSIQDSVTPQTAASMCCELACGFEQVGCAAEALASLAGSLGDDATADLAASRARACSKAAWMLKSHTPQAV